MQASASGLFLQQNRPTGGIAISGDSEPLVIAEGMVGKYYAQPTAGFLRVSEPIAGPEV